MKLSAHTQVNREFFEKNSHPARATWIDWIQRGVVVGKVIEGKPYIDANWFASTRVMGAKPIERQITGLDLLTRRRRKEV